MARKAHKADQRVAACTHTTVTRLFDYDPHGLYRCDMCRRYPSIGWVYRCTQDHASFLPETDFTEPHNKLIKTYTIGRIPCRELSLWIKEAIKNDLYTSEQVTKIIDQKEGVRDAILGQHSNDDTHSSCSDDSSTSSKSAHSTSADSINQDTSNEMRDNQYDAMSPSAGSVSISSQNWKSAVEWTYLPCTWKCCHTCRPTYRERAFQSLNVVLNEPHNPPPVWELDNRRISDVRILQTLGLPKLRHVRRTYDDLHYEGKASTFTSISSQSGGYGRNSTENTTFRHKSGFRETVRKILNQARGESMPDTSLTRTSSKNSSQESFLVFKPSKLFARRRSKEPNTTPGYRVIEDGQLQDLLLLMIASKTPLPSAAEDTENLEGEEVKVEDGVAVTEEGVSLSAANIIMHS